MRRILLLTGLLALALLTGCGEHDHSHGPGQAAHDHPHPHPGEEKHELEPPDQSVTQFGESTELFVEFPALVKERSWPFAVHLTRLSDFKPLTEGTVTVILSGGDAPEERFVQPGPTRPGYFRAVVAPQHAGLREVTLEVEAGELRDTHELGPYVVYRSIADAINSEPVEDEAESSDEISFLKEQQWKLDFRLDPVKLRTIRPAMVTNGTLKARRPGEAWVTAPQEGRLLAAEGEFPHMGVKVEKGQVLAVLALPFHESGTDKAGLELAVEKAKVELAAARKELQRLEPLLRQDAVPERRVIEARARVQRVEAELETAEERMQHFQAMQRSQGEGAAGRIEIRAPVTGTVVASSVVPGVFVHPGDELFHLIDLERLWLEVHVHAVSFGQIKEARGAWFEVEGFERPFEATPESGARLVTTGGVVDPETRTVPVIFEMPNPDGFLRVGMYARVRLLTGPPRQAVAIPRSAIIEEEGKTVAYVQLGGESFERRVLELGTRDGDWVEVLSGIEEDEVLVTRGAYYVRLAAAGGAVPSHGHAH